MAAPTNTSENLIKILQDNDQKSFEDWVNSNISNDESKTKILFQTLDDTNNTILHLLASHGQTSMLSFLLSRISGIENDLSSLNQATSTSTPRYVTVVSDVLSSLPVNLMGSNPLYMATERGLTSMIILMLQHHANVNLTLPDGSSCLYVAAQKGNVQLVKLLLHCQANVNLNKSNGTSPLWIATQQDHVDIVSLLLEARANVHSKKKNGVSVLNVASELNRAQIMELLLIARADPNDVDEHQPPSHHRNSISSTSSLSVASSSSSTLVPRPSSALLSAVRNRHTEATQLLLAANANINNQTYFQQQQPSPLFTACSIGANDIVGLLIEAKANINDQRSDDGASALFVAVASNNHETVSLLCNAKASLSRDIKWQDRDILQVAQEQADEKMIQLLQQYL